MELFDEIERLRAELDEVGALWRDSSQSWSVGCWVLLGTKETQPDYRPRKLGLRATYRKLVAFGAACSSNCLRP